MVSVQKPVEQIKSPTRKRPPLPKPDISNFRANLEEHLNAQQNQSEISSSENYLPSDEELILILSSAHGLDDPDSEIVQSQSAERIHLRTPGLVKEFLDQAAATKGMTLSRYILTNMIAIASQDLASMHSKNLTPEAYERLLHIITDRTVQLSEGAKQAAEIYRKFVKGAK